MWRRERVHAPLSHQSSVAPSRDHRGRPKESLDALGGRGPPPGSVLAHHDLACLYWNGIPGVMNRTRKSSSPMRDTAAEAGLARARRPWPASYLPPPACRRTTPGTPVGRTGRESREQPNDSHLVPALFQRLGSTQGLQESRRICRAGRSGRPSQRPSSSAGFLYWNGCLTTPGQGQGPALLRAGRPTGRRRRVALGGPLL